MNEAVFISDLHLHPDMPGVFQRFRAFIRWAATHTKSVYILGDFLHVWPGDDAIDAWSDSITELLAWLSLQGVQVYFMPGNRDFLVGQVFMEKAKLIPLQEPALITLGTQKVLLVHGDVYCTHDRGHQWFRTLTRNPVFRFVFLKLPYSWRKGLVSQVREYSQQNTNKSMQSMAMVVDVMLRDMSNIGANVIVHGHTHQPGLKVHHYKESDFQQYTLSDWDNNPSILCYNNAIYEFSNVLGDS